MYPFEARFSDDVKIGQIHYNAIQLTLQILGKL